MFSEQPICRIRKNSVKKTLELFTNINKKTKRKIFENNKEESKTYSRYCKSIIYNKNLTNIAFSSSFVMAELRLCLMKHDWINVQRLFPILLELSNNKEAIIWRYVLIILIHSPMSNSNHIKEFLNFCIGCQNDNYNYVLDKLITLRNLH